MLVDIRIDDSFDRIMIADYTWISRQREIDHGEYFPSNKKAKKKK